MRGAHGVEPEPLHLDQVCAHRLHGDDASGVGVLLVPVHAAQELRFAIDEDAVAFEGDVADADAGDALVGDLAVGFQRRDELVEVRRVR